jgi:hypothetical protein
VGPGHLYYTGSSDKTKSKLCHFSNIVAQRRQAMRTQNLYDGRLPFV